MNGFPEALAFVLKREGGYSNHAADRGGPTDCGVTQETFDRWLELKGQPQRPVKGITNDEVLEVYHDLYWIAGKCDDMPWPVSLAHFDAWVQHNPRVAAAMLQRAAGVKDDGVIGPKTLAAVAAAAPAEIVNRMLWERIRLYQIISKGDQLTFLRGWLDRVLHLRAAVT